MNKLLCVSVLFTKGERVGTYTSVGVFSSEDEAIGEGYRNLCDAEGKVDSANIAVTEVTHEMIKEYVESSLRQLNAAGNREVLG